MMDSLNALAYEANAAEHVAWVLSTEAVNVIDLRNAVNPHVTFPVSGDMIASIRRGDMRDVSFRLDMADGWGGV